MLIPINIDLPTPAAQNRPKLPPQLVPFGTDELVLLELQGALEVEGEGSSSGSDLGSGSSSRDGQLVGRLRVDPATEKPTLAIGHHLLEGTLVRLNKPLAVLHRHRERVRLRADADADAMDMDADADGNGDDAMDTDAHGDGDAMHEDADTRAGAGSQWDVVAVVKRKMVFAKRPMPIAGARGGAPRPVSALGRGGGGGGGRT